MQCNETITEPKVLHSAAGYYIGREYYDRLSQAWLPYDRISRYYLSVKTAEMVLKNNSYVGT
mgnify:CR=1 FL=1